jgi:D-beta-D-heptose 7-phosphate kinase/D-beta-D-heptose 1-phosphate adenosyltransferase
MHESIANKIFEWGPLLNEVQLWKKKGIRIVFTNGVFDLLHPGHADYLARAAALGDKLVVAVNSDASVKTLHKGPGRPVNPQAARAALLAWLASVDAVTVFDDSTPQRLIEAILPDVLAKGGDYNPDCTDPQDPRFLVGSDTVKARGGRVIAIPLLEGFSSTAIIEKIKRNG